MGYAPSEVRPAALALAQRARATAASLARALALIFLRPLLARVATAPPFPPAHLALWAAAILPLAAADILLRPLRAGSDARDRTVLRSLPNSVSNVATRSLIATARRSCWIDRFASKFAI